MALIKAIQKVSPYGVDLTIVKWEGLAAGDEAVPVHCSYKQDKTISWKASTVGSSVLTIQGTPDPEMAADTFFVMHDSRGAAFPLILTMQTTSQGLQCDETVYAMKPVLTGGAGTAGVDVWLHAKGR